MVAVWVHDMGDFKKVTVSASAMDPNEYAARYWGEGQLVWLREVADKTEGLAIQKAIMSAGVPFNPENEKLTSKTCFTGEVDFDSVECTVEEKQSWVHLKEFGSYYTVHCTSKPPREALWCVRFDLGGGRFKDKVTKMSESYRFMSKDVVKNFVPLNELLEGESNYEICDLSIGVYLKKVGPYFKCATADFPGELVWHAKISTPEKAAEFAKFIHYKLSSSRTYYEGHKCFVPSGFLDLPLCVARYKEWVAEGKPGLEIKSTIIDI